MITSLVRHGGRNERYVRDRGSRRTSGTQDDHHFVAVIIDRPEVFLSCVSWMCELFQLARGESRAGSIFAKRIQEISLDM